MRPVEFTNEAVIKAGEELQAQNRNITGFALRQKTGGGTPARLKQVWDEHISSQSVTVAEPVSELPVEVADAVAGVSKALSERIAALAVELNDKAVKASERRVHEVVRSAGEQREQAERELVDATQTLDDLEGKLDAAQAVNVELEAQLEVAKTTAQKHAFELEGLRERFAALSTESQRIQEAAQAEAEAHTKTRQLLAAANAKADATAEAQQAENKRLSAEASRAKLELTGALNQASEARENAAIISGQLLSTTEQLKAVTAALAKREPTTKTNTPTVTKTPRPSRRKETQLSLSIPKPVK